MEQDSFNHEEFSVEQKSSMHQVTPLSKYLALALFIILPFVGGYIGYTFAPEKTVEVEKIVEIEPKENIEISTEFKRHPSLHASELADGMALLRDVSSTFLDLNELDNQGNKSMPVILIGGDVDADSVFVSSDKKYVSFRGYRCSRVLGGHCFGGFYVRDTEEQSLSTKQEKLIELRGDEQAPFNLAEEPGSVAPGPLYKFGTFTGWDSENRLNLEIKFEGTVYKYRSLSNIEPWILEYLGPEIQ